jgi:hypothetical protein
MSDGAVASIARDDRVQPAHRVDPGAARSAARVSHHTAIIRV